MGWKSRWAAVGVVFGFISGSICWTRIDASARLRVLDERSAGKSVEGKKSAAVPSGGMRRTVANSYEKLPLNFEQNDGQTDPAVKFLLRAKDYNLFLTADGAGFVFNNSQPSHRDEEVAALSQTVDLMSMKFVGANPAVLVSGLDQLPGRMNYLIGNDPKLWHTNVPTFARVRYKNIYPGVDLVYYGGERGLEYDFVVSPGTDPRVIQLNFGGVDGLRVDKQGALVLRTKHQAARFERPFVYQEIQGKRRVIEGRYSLKGEVTGFSVSNYDRTLPLIIDPVLVYSTYLGGSRSDSGTSIAVDTAGNAYVTGTTASTDFPLVNAMNPHLTGAFVTKFAADGSSLVYSTFIGGTGGERGQGIAVDSAGDAYVIGITNSVDFPTVNPVQSKYGGKGDAFIAELNPTGSAFVYSTFLGGSGSDTGWSIAIDPAGNTYATGFTYSTDFPTVGAIQPSLSGGASAGFVAKISAGGSALTYSTYLNYVNGRGIAADESGDAYVTGSAGNGFTTTTGAYQPTFIGTGDAFVAELNPSGSAFVYSTYLGANNGQTFAWGIAVDASEDAYITGATISTDFPTVNPAQSCGAKEGGAFVTKFNAGGSALVYSTFVGQCAAASGSGIAVDSEGNAYVTGSTSDNFPLYHPILTSHRGATDFYVGEISASGSTFIYLTHLGGSGTDQSNGIAVDSVGNAYVTGNTLSTDFPTAQPFQSQNKNTGGTGFVTKVGGVALSPSHLTYAAQNVGTTSPAQTVTSYFSGNGKLNITNISITGADAEDFAETNDCTSSSIPAGGTCTINVTFAPTSNGSRKADLEILDNSGNGPQSVALTGSGVIPVTLTPTSAKFANQRVGTTSAAKTFTLDNVLSTTLNSITITTTGDFSVSSTTCGTTLGGKAKCTIGVVFSPSVTGTRTGTLTVSDSASNSPQSSQLSGTGD
jgi:hypothetical protein